MAMKSKPPNTGSRTNNHGYASRIPIVHGVGKVLSVALLQIASVAGAPLAELSHKHLPSAFKRVEEPDAEDPSLWLYLGIAAVLVLLGGAFAGLTIA